MPAIIFVAIGLFQLGMLLVMGLIIVHQDWVLLLPWALGEFAFYVAFRHLLNHLKAKDARTTRSR